MRELLKLDTHNKIFFGKAGLTLVLRGSLGVKLHAKGGDAAALQRQREIVADIEVNKLELLGVPWSARLETF